MKLLSFNLCGEVKGNDDKIEALGKIVESKRPEFLALQEVTSDTIKKLKRTTWATRYSVIQPPYRFETRMKPTVALFSTYPADDSYTWDYEESKTDRLLQRGNYVMHDKAKQPFVIAVATTSLEKSLKESALREKQLNEAMYSMVKVHDAFLIGGFCLDNDIDGELSLNGGWEDAWLSVPGHTETNGHVYNPAKNALIGEDPHGPGRPDRIFIKSRHFKIESVELVGVEPYQLPRQKDKAITISKHYGILATVLPLDNPRPIPEEVETPANFKKAEWSVQFEENPQ